MGNAHFAKVPNISLPRTKMKQSFTHSTTFNFADLVPIDCFEVLPGDSFSLKLSSLIRMSQPIAPVMDSLEMDIHAFFIPLRLVYKDTEEFFGANKTSAGYQQQTFRIPMAPLHVVSNDVSSYIGKPVTDKGYASVLKERCYLLTWSEWYRAQQVQDPFVMLDSDDTYLEDSTDPFEAAHPAVVGHIGQSTFNLGYQSQGIDKVPLMKVCKKLDYFTACTISPQYGEEVLLPLGESAPLKRAFPIGIGEGSSDAYIPAYIDDGDDVLTDTSQTIDLGTDTITEGDVSKQILTDNGTTLLLDISKMAVADLSKATAASVNQIRYAFQLEFVY